MTKSEQLELIEEAIEVEKGSLTEDTELSSIDEWGSMAALSLIVLMDEEFGKKLTNVQIKQFKKVSDILDYINIKQ